MASGPASAHAEKPGSVPWIDGAVLRCSLCGKRRELGPVWGGCDDCGFPLEVVYGDPAYIGLPIAREAIADLGRVPTPLIPFGNGSTWLKLELCNPTGSHKDRFHSVAAAIGRLLGARGIVTTSSGNHGVSCAAHAAREGLPCVVLATGTIPSELALEIAAHGALVATMAAEERSAAVCRLVEGGWLPATSSDPSLSGAGNPYGGEGYRDIATEIVDVLGRTPDVIAMPVASGDTLVGVVRGFEALHASGHSRPAVLACQPEAAPALARSLEAGHQVVVEVADTIARSTADPKVGRLAISALARRDRVVLVPEREIVAATRQLTHYGIYAEPSSALALAGLELARHQRWVAHDALAAILVTASGRGWLGASEVIRYQKPVTSLEALLESAGALQGSPGWQGIPSQE